MILTNDVGTTTEGGPKLAVRLTAPVGYNVQLYKGGAWFLQPQAVLTLGTGNAAITIVSRGTTAVSVAVALQAASQPVTHTYAAGALVIKPATNATPAQISTSAELAAYINSQIVLGGPLGQDFLVAIAGGTGAGVTAIVGANSLVPVNCWVPGAKIQTDITSQPVGEAGIARGEDSSVHANNIGGLPGAIYATAEQGIHKWQNYSGASPFALASIGQVAYLYDDNTLANFNVNGGPRAGLVVGFSINKDEVFIDETR